MCVCVERDTQIKGWMVEFREIRACLFIYSFMLHTHIHTLINSYRLGPRPEVHQLAMNNYE